MSSAALALVVLAAVLHASWNFVSKKSAAGSEFVLLYEIFALLIYFPLLFFLQTSISSHACRSKGGC